MDQEKCVYRGCEVGQFCFCTGTGTAGVFFVYLSIVRELFLTVSCDSLCHLQVYGAQGCNPSICTDIVVSVPLASVVCPFLKAISRSSAISACCSWKDATLLLRDFTSFTLRVDVIAFNSAARCGYPWCPGDGEARGCSSPKICYDLVYDLQKYT